MMTCEPSVRFNSSTIPPTSCGISTGTGLRSDRKSTRLNSSHLVISYAVFCLKKKKNRAVYLDGIQSCQKIGTVAIEGISIQLGDGLRQQRLNNSPVPLTQHLPIAEHCIIMPL